MLARSCEPSPASRERVASHGRGEPGEGAPAPPRPDPRPQWGRGRIHRPSRRNLLASAAAIPIAALTGCGWEPLYADRAAGPADAELAAIKVAPIPERIGQLLALGLRQWLNPAGAPVPTRYLLRTLLQVTRLDLGVLQLGLGTRARLDIVANFTLIEIASGAQLFAATSHAAESFDILSNYYVNVVAEEDARKRAIEEVRRDMVTQLTVFLQRRAAAAAPLR